MNFSLALGKDVEQACITAPPEKDYMPPSYLTSMLPRFCKRAGLPRVSPHQLRHTYCTLLFASGVDLKTVQYLMGHVNPGTTLKVYTHYMESNGVKAAGAINSLMQSLPASAPQVVTFAGAVGGRQLRALTV